MDTWNQTHQSIYRREAPSPLVHQKFYSNYDISFMEYFLELTTHEGEFVVHHEKLVEYGIMTSNRSSNMKQKLDALELVENIDYSLPPRRLGG